MCFLFTEFLFSELFSKSDFLFAFPFIAARRQNPNLVNIQGIIPVLKGYFFRLQNAKQQKNTMFHCPEGVNNIEKKEHSLSGILKSVKNKSNSEKYIFNG